ncbi:survival motor neuron protein [Patella vulgata]|uniref:survival motor neuron protein n=1 Tax=Patella vulgata TaxID=6465 RepID=UPI00218065FD|nr:survival motor neuron protein [Patella vulgata]
MAGAEGGFVLFQRGDSEDSDAWDDTALIKAYDEAVSAVKAKLNGGEIEDTAATSATGQVKRGRGKKKKSKSKNKPRKKQKWQVGDLCRAVYSEDDFVYDAKIISIDTSNNTCVVQYIDYGNEEEQNLADLQRPSSNSFSDKLTSASETESVGYERHSKHNYSDGPDLGAANQNSWNYPGFHPPPPPFPGMMPPPFPPGSHMPSYRASHSPRIPSLPPPPPFLDEDVDDDNEALYSMLISWYMNGYHTGYYQGLKQGRSQSLGRVSSRSGVR